MWIAHVAFDKGERSLRSAIFKAKLSLVLPDEQLSPEQMRLFRAMPVEKRLHLAEQLYWSARKLKRTGLRLQHPEWSEQQLDQEVRRLFLNART